MHRGLGPPPPPPPRRRRRRLEPFQPPSGIRGPVGVPKPPKPKLPPGIRGPVGTHPGSEIANRTPTAGSGGKAIAGTIPAHAKTPARKSNSLGDATPAAKARAANRRARRHLGVAPVPPPVPDYTAQAMQMLDPQFMGLEQERGRYEQAAAERQSSIQDFTQALIATLKGEPAQAASDYDTAIAQTQALSQASSQALQAANPNAKVQADLAAIGAPAAQQQQVAQALGQTFAGGGAVLGHVGGTIPEQTMLASKAAQLGYLHTLPFVTGARGFQEFDRAMRDRAIVEEQFRGRRAQLEAQVPGLTQQLQSSAEDAAVKRQALAVNQDIARASLGIRGATAAASIQRGRALTAQGRRRLKQGDVALQLRALQTDRQWQATLRRLGIQEAGLRLRATELEARRRAKARNGGFTRYQRSQLQKRAQEAADLAYYGQEPVTRSGGTVLKEGVPAIDYQTAIFRMMAGGVPLVFAQKALNAYFKKGERGRPYLSYQERRRSRRRRGR